MWEGPNIEGALRGAIAGPQLGHVIVWSCLPPRYWLRRRRRRAGAVQREGALRAPSLARSLVTLLPVPSFVTQILVPSKASLSGLVPTGKVVVIRGPFEQRDLQWIEIMVAFGAHLLCNRWLHKQSADVEQERKQKRADND